MAGYRDTVRTIVSIAYHYPATSLFLSLGGLIDGGEWMERGTNIRGTAWVFISGSKPRTCSTTARHIVEVALG